MPERTDRRAGHAAWLEQCADAARRAAQRAGSSTDAAATSSTTTTAGSGAEVHRAGGHARSSRSPLAGVRAPAVVAAPALRPSVKRLVLAAALACLAGYAYAYGSGRAGAPIRSDAFSYYVYLPSWLLHHDPSLDSVAADCCGGTFPAWTAIIRWPETQRWVDAHPIGEALLIAPFFLVAHALTGGPISHPAVQPVLARGLAGLLRPRGIVVSAAVAASTLHGTDRQRLSPGTSFSGRACFITPRSTASGTTPSRSLCAALLERLDAPSFAKASEGSAKTS